MGRLARHPSFVRAMGSCAVLLVLLGSSLSLAARGGAADRADLGVGGAVPLGPHAPSAGVTVTATGSPNPTDVGVPVKFNASATPCGLGCSYAWTWDDGTTAATTADTSHTFYVAKTYNVTCWANGTLGDGTAVIAIRVSPLLSVEASGSQDIADVGQTVTLTAKSTGGTSPVGFAWVLGDRNRSSVDSPTEFFGARGTYGNQVWANDSVGASAHAWWNLTVNDRPRLSPFASPTTLTAGEVGNFSANVTGGSHPISFLWAFGDGNRTNGANVTHAFLAPGSYEPHIFANDSAGVLVESTVNVTVLPGLAAIPTVSTNPALVSSVLTFKGQVQGGDPPYTFAWTFGDGGTSSDQNATHAYAAVGDYPVNFWANDSGGHHAHGALTVHVDTPLVAQAYVSPSPGDAGASEDFTVSASGGEAPYTILWRFGDGSMASGSSVSHSYAFAGNYTVEAAVNDSAGRQATSTLNVAINPSLILRAGASETATDADVADQFIAVTTGGTTPITLSWVLDDGARSFNASFSHAFQSAGEHRATVWANDSAGVSESSTLLVSVAPALKVDPASNTSSVRVGVPISLSANFTGGTGPYTVVWHLGDGSASSATNLTHTYDAPGVYTARVWVNDSVGQSVTGLVSLTVLAGPASSPRSLLSYWPWLLLVLVGLVLLLLWWSRHRASKVAPPPTSPADTMVVPPGSAPTFLPAERADHTGEGGDLPPWPQPQYPLTFFEGVDPGVLYRTAMVAKVDPALLFVLTLEEPAELEEKYALKGATIWQLSRLEGERKISPAQADMIANLAETHLMGGPGRSVLVGGTESILATCGLPTTVRFVHFLHEVAASHGGLLIFYLNPRNVTLQELRSLEEGGRKVRFGPKRPGLRSP